MVQIVLIRPGSTEFDEQGRIQGTLDIPLTAQGRVEALGAVEGVRGKTIEAIYTSPCQAAVETGEVISKALGVKLKHLEQLRNLDHGLWQGMCIQDLKEKQPKVFRQWQEHPETVCPPEGEMLAAACDRIDIVLDKLRRWHRQGAIAVVVPEPLAGLFQSRMTGKNLAGTWKTGSECGKWDVVQFGADGIAAGA